MRSCIGEQGEMKNLELSRFALAMSVAAALLAGCGGSQPPISSPRAIPQTSATTHQLTSSHCSGYLQAAILGGHKRVLSIALDTRHRGAGKLSFRNTSCAPQRRVDSRR
jgi:hypothetical protein